MKKYKMEVYFETNEEFESVGDVLAGSVLLDADFRGAITSCKLKER